MKNRYHPSLNEVVTLLLLRHTHTCAHGWHSSGWTLFSGQVRTETSFDVEQVRSCFFDTQSLVCSVFDVWGVSFKWGLLLGGLIFWKINIGMFLSKVMNDCVFSISTARMVMSLQVFYICWLGFKPQILFFSSKPNIVTIKKLFHCSNMQTHDIYNLSGVFILYL